MAATEKALAEVPGLDAVGRRLLAGRNEPVSAPSGTVVFQPGQACERLVLLTKGMVRVRMVSETGREIELYRVRPGDMCVMSVACLMGERPYQAEGIADGDIEGVAISRGLFRELLAQSEAFRETVIAVQTRRIFDLVSLVDELAFHRTEARLAARLLQRASQEDVVPGTHQELALDIGTAREVVSRRLKRFETQGLVALERGRVRILDRAGLGSIIGGEA
ncbi:MAG: Crp/Fnr family transcriptional regulator [Hyphomicrobiaceae bacterium]|nr:Crp/Fnr family transcriptional regulator [Hyphomicrobiaceae bacterium]